MRDIVPMSSAATAHIKGGIPLIRFNFVREKYDILNVGKILVLLVVKGYSKSNSVAINQFLPNERSHCYQRAVILQDF